jgi:NADPH2:quinone reductase
MANQLPTTMRQIVITHPGDADVLTTECAPIPKPGELEVLIHVEGAGLNRADISQRQGNYPPPPGASQILGMEVAGTIAALGSEVAEWNVGDKVCAILAGGGYAEYCVAPSKQCLPVPQGLSMVDAASLPEAAFTVWMNLFQRAHLTRGESLLVQGGSSGIGTFAIQWAHALGVRVFTTAGSDEKCEVCRTLGAEVAINYHDFDFVEKVKQETAERGVDVILDIVGGSYFARNIKALAKDGRLVQISVQEASVVEIDLALLMAKGVTLTCSTLRRRTVGEKAGIAAELKKYVWPLLEEGKIKPIVYQTFHLSEATAAHRLLESSQHIGKIVLIP